LGANALQRAAELQPVADAVLGPAIAPGLYSLGDPRQVEHGGQILRAQAAAVITNQQQALGTVVLLRDMTEEVKQSQAREQVLAQLSADVQQPLATMSQQGALHSSPLVNEFAREIARHSAALQKMIVDMRELTQYNRTSARHVQRPLAVETLLWALVNDWRQIAAAAGLTLQTEIGQTNLYVLGDESKLRLALGNLVDNAIKYTPSGGAVSLEIKGEVNGAVHVRIRDNGVGISRDDLSSLFMPFYRGTPVTSKGEIIHVPGMGQGLAISRQIIEAHGGVLKVKSRVGVGTAVYLALPLTAGVPLTMPPADYQDSATIVLPDNVDMELLWKRR
jgi:signal transduction histidine kinase